MSKLDERSLKVYNAINNFVSALHEMYGTRNKPLALYNRLIEKTTFRDVEPIKKHINSFDKFLTNYKAHLLKDVVKLPQGASVKYSDRAYLDMHQILSYADKPTLKVIKQHLLTIEGLLHPDDEQALNELQRETQPPPNPFGNMFKNDGSKESNFINGLMEDIQNSMGDGDMDMSNPMAAITNLMSSGVAQKMMSGLQSGEMDLGKLMGSVQGMMSALTDNLPKPNESKEKSEGEESGEGGEGEGSDEGGEGEGSDEGGEGDVTDVSTSTPVDTPTEVNQENVD